MIPIRFSPGYDATFTIGFRLFPEARDDALRAALASLLRAPLEKAIKAAIVEEGARHHDAMSATDRDRAFADLGDRTERLSIKDELIVSRLESAGLETLRGPDAPPAAVLCLSDDASAA